MRSQTRRLWVRAATRSSGRACELKDKTAQNARAFVSCKTSAMEAAIDGCSAVCSSTSGSSGRLRHAHHPLDNHV